MADIKKTILGQSAPIKELLDLIERVALSRTSVLIIGESGTGKELVARLIHDSSPLAGRAFVPVNCGAIPENLIESELFGHKKGSFTGAVSDKMGLFEVANAGTLFLDEIGELPLHMQVKLLRTLQDRTVRRVGDNEDRKIDVRIIAATNRDLETLTREGKFREDLYYRLNVIQIKTPPLRERGEDIEVLANNFIERCAAKQGKKVSGYDEEVGAAFLSYRWPGNVRELENVIERAVTLTPDDKVHLDMLPPPLIEAFRIQQERGSEASGGKVGGKSVVVGGAGIARGFSLPEPNFDRGAIQLDEILNGVEKTYLLKALEHTGGVKKKAAEFLGITFRSIRYRLKKLGLDDKDDKDGEE